MEFDEFDVSALDPGARYQLLTSIVVPRPIGWISTYGAEGVPNLAPFSYFNVFASKVPQCRRHRGAVAYLQ